MIDLHLCRSLLFLPASNPRAIEKARGLPADMIVLDCEDAVKDEEKESARSAAVAAAAEGFGERLCAIRINPAGGAYYGADVIAVRDSKADFVVLPKAESAEVVRNSAGLSGKPVIAMIESPAGVLAAPAIAREARALMIGTNDLAAALGLPADPARSGLQLALQTVVLAARAAGIAAFDGVYNRLSGDEGLVAECAQGRMLGFDGKSLIHPSQIDAANRAFAPTQADIEAARSLVAAATGGAERHDGRMIEAMHVAQARALLARAQG
jgi:(3S)-malyl-CoA thioesterase